ncbi:hypothetical protein LEP3755_29350 [Leptolyngbya sp. NIES-3755]|nr:hypothetical protein LEP3755_29350 [Leptolyngbya sp. NIES-3755]
MDIQSNLTAQLNSVPIHLLEPKCYSDSNCCTFGDAVQQVFVDPETEVPFIIWLFENPSSPIALPGEIDLYGHDCMHILLDLREHSLADEAFIIGFTMGNDTRTNRLHQLIYKLVSSTLYPKKYRFSWNDFQAFDAGFAYGRSLQVSNLNQLDFSAYKNHPVSQVRQQLGVSKVKVHRTRNDSTETPCSVNAMYRSFLV